MRKPDQPLQDRSYLGKREIDTVSGNLIPHEAVQQDISGEGQGDPVCRLCLGCLTKNRRDRDQHKEDYNKYGSSAHSGYSF